MIPKSGKSPADSRKSVGIHEFAALARSSLNGNDLLFFYLPFVLFTNSVLNSDSDSDLSLSLFVQVSLRQ